MFTLVRTSFSVFLLIVVNACGGGAANVPLTTSAPGSGTPTDAPSDSPNFGSIDHPMGAMDVVLRFEEGGGFVMPAFLATQAPVFSLYGDGTIIFRNSAQDPLEPIGSVYPQHPLRTARLTEAQVQDLLTFALGESGLGMARPEYPNDQIADAPTSIFTVNAGGLKKSVSIYALGFETEGAQDAAARAAFRKLADRLQNIDDGGGFTTAEYAPDRFRGLLLDGQAGLDARPWPWAEVSPKEFVANGDPNAFQLPARLMSVDEVKALGIEPYAGGFQGLTLIGPNDGNVYSFSLRPLLPDESE
jgi:hypothetical protein